MCNKKIHNISHRAVDFFPHSFRLLLKEKSVCGEEKKNCEFRVLYAITTSLLLTSEWVYIWERINRVMLRRLLFRRRSSIKKYILLVALCFIRSACPLLHCCIFISQYVIFCCAKLILESRVDKLDSGGETLSINFLHKSLFTFHYINKNFIIYLISFKFL
jgi:hypothetical protein